MGYVASITTSARENQHVRILDFYLALGRIRISIPGLNPGFPYLVCKNIMQDQAWREISQWPSGYRSSVDLKVPGSDLAGGGIQGMTVWHFITQSLSLSLFNVSILLTEYWKGSKNLFIFPHSCFSVVSGHMVLCCGRWQHWLPSPIRGFLMKKFWDM